MAAVSLLVQKFNASYAQRPNTTAQVLTAVRSKSQPQRKLSFTESVNPQGIEFEDMDRKNPWPRGGIINNLRSLPPSFDFERLARFMAYGFIMAPIQFKWFGFLSKTFPITKSAGTIPALKRVAFDQLIFSPIGMYTSVASCSMLTSPGLACFFTFMTVAEGGGKRMIARKFQDVYVPALKANYILWPAVQILNFRVVPLQFQIVSSPYISHRYSR
ncbi:hypothetical protein MRB53_040390 [Persea americana]|nr:hypothetical protein MRB53_040390 [Persea americana]